MAEALSLDGGSTSRLLTDGKLCFGLILIIDEILNP